MSSVATTREVIRRERDRVLSGDSVAAGAPVKLIFLLMFLSAAYDKSGITLTLAGRSVSLAVYKGLYVLLLAHYFLTAFTRPTKRAVTIDRSLYVFVVGFVVIQSLASLVGNLFTSGEIALSSEFYYSIQRSSFLFIPLMALRYNLSPRTILKMFVATVVIHYLFIGLQFLSPPLYNRFMEKVADPLRPDNALGWAGESLDFIGLQRTGNYGSFAASFGLLLLAFRPKRGFGKLAKSGLVLFTIFIALFGPSRAVLIMVAVSLIVYFKNSRLFLRTPTYFWGFLSAAMLVALQLSGMLRLESFSSIYAFVSEEREASTDSKINIAANSWLMIAESPIVGWGQQRFLNIQNAMNVDLNTEFTHSFALSTLLGSGLIGLLAYLALFFKISRALWGKKEKDCAVVCAMFVGLGFYNVVYDAGHLDLFACFNGVAAYYALSKNPTERKPIHSLSRQTPQLKPPVACPAQQPDSASC